MRRLHHVAMLTAILLLAFGLRVWGLAHHSIWWDEGIGVWLARLPVLESIRWTATDSHPPLHYAILRRWWLLAGEGEVVLRFPSVVAGFLTVVFAYKLGRLLGSATTSLLAALLIAISRFSIIWSQEIRMYGLATTLTTGSLWAAVWLWRTSGRSSATRPGRAWLAYVGFTAGALYTLYLTGSVLAVTNLAFLAVARRRRWHRSTLLPWITAHIAVVALILPWLLYALPRMHSLSTDDPFNPGFFLRLYATMLAVGSPLDLDRYVPWIITILVGMALGTIAIAANLSKGQRDGDHRPTGEVYRRNCEVHRQTRIAGLMMLVAGLLLPPLAVVVLALPQLNLGFSRSVAPRYLLPLSACYAVLLAWGVDTLMRRDAAPSRPGAGALTTPRRTGKAGQTPPIEHPVWPAFWRSLGAATGAIAIAAALVGLSTFYTGRARRDDYVTIAEILRCHRHPTDAVLLYVDRDWPIFAAHYAGPRHDLPYGASLSDPATVETTLAPIWETASAVWLVSTPESLQADPLQAVPQWLATRSAVARTLVDGENTLTLYTRSELDDRVRETILPGTTLPTRIATAHSLVGAHLPLPRYRTGDIVHLGLYWIPPVPANVQVTVDNGTSRVQYEVAPPSADRNIARSQVDIPLTADLSGGSYAITVDVPGYAPALVGEPTLVGTFRLIASTVEAPGVVAATSISHRTDVRFAAPNGGSPGGLTPVGFIELVGYDLPKATVAPGEAVALTLYWRTETPLTERYKVFTHLLGETFNAGSGNFLWGQQDNEPGNGQALTTLWPSDTIIADSYRIPVDPQAPPGSYTVEIGMYGLVNGVRLHATARGLVVADDAVLLARVVVQ